MLGLQVEHKFKRSNLTYVVFRDIIHNFNINIFTPLLWGIIKTKTRGSFLEGLFVIEGQLHCDPHQNYCWCNALARIMSSVNQKKWK